MLKQNETTTRLGLESTAMYTSVQMAKFVGETYLSSMAACTYPYNIRSGQVLEHCLLAGEVSSGGPRHHGAQFSRQLS